MSSRSQCYDPGHQTEEKTYPTEIEHPSKENSTLGVRDDSRARARRQATKVGREKISATYRVGEWSKKRKLVNGF